MSLSGGCLCGALRYTAVAKPTSSGYCHCRLCQRSTGAPVLAFASVPFDSFQMTHGQPARYASSTKGERWFCARCGTQIAYCDKHNPVSVDINTGSLDHPESVPPKQHIFTSSRIEWFETNDDLPRYPESNGND